MCKSLVKLCEERTITMIYNEHMYIIFFEYYINLFIQLIVLTVCKIYCNQSFRYKLC